MIPIQDLLHRIQWDAEFGQASFEISYYDRIKESLVRVPLERIQLAQDDHFGFEAWEADGSAHSVPFHRVREVWRDGELIWHRDPPPGTKGAKK